MADDRETLPGARHEGGADLLLVVGNGQLLTRPLDDELVIGRDEACDVALDDRALSRRHAILRRAPLAIQDLDSMNGVKLARGILRGGDPALLEPGESFHIGGYTFIVMAATTAEPSAQRSGRDRLLILDPTPAGVSSLVREIARSEINVLIQGETGVGKEVLATTIHGASGRGGPLSSVNCAALSEGLLESELFGHEKGAFTGAVAAKQGLLEAAAGGTVFLDEIGEMPQTVQAKLLRAIESREIRRVGSTKAIAIDTRFIAATNRELPDEVAEGRFREDLYFRIDGVSLRIPPLRERPAAIAPLALRFIDEAGKRLGRAVHGTPELFAALAAHDWPGNVRELKAVIDRAVLLARGAELAPRHLAFSERRRPRTPAAAPEPATENLDFLSADERAERARIIAAIEECAGNQTRAAKLLGMSRTTMVSRLALYRVPRPRT